MEDSRDAEEVPAGPVAPDVAVARVELVAPAAKEVLAGPVAPDVVVARVALVAPDVVVARAALVAPAVEEERAALVTPVELGVLDELGVLGAVEARPLDEFPVPDVVE